jgi:hypothetical protein
VTRKWILRSAAFAALFALCGLTGSRPMAAKDALPEGGAGLLIESDIAFLKKALSKEPEKRAVPTLKAAAMMIALNAQNNLDGKDGDKMAAIRAQALTVAAELTAKNFPGAKAAVDGFDTAKGGDKKALKLHELHKFDLAELMSQFRAGKVGGRNLEADLKEQAKKVTDVKLVAEAAARTAVIGQYSLDLPAEKAVGAKKKMWDDLSKEMKKLGEEAAVEATKGAKADTAGLAKKLQAINANCTACHNEFR